MVVPPFSDLAFLPFLKVILIALSAKMGLSPILRVTVDLFSLYLPSLSFRGL